MTTNTLTLVQEVYFDLCDLIESNNLAKTKIKGFYEFENLDQFIQEQKTKITQIEKALDFQDQTLSKTEQWVKQVNKDIREGLA